MNDPEAYIPNGRLPFLPLNCRSGWELLVKLERYGFKIFCYDLMPEDEIIRLCTDYFNSSKYSSMVKSENEIKIKTIKNKEETNNLVARNKIQWRVKATINNAWR